jgi:hypothetical protein
VNGVYELFCECGESGCMRRVEVPAKVYNELRLEIGRHLVSRGHGNDGSLVADGDTYRVVVYEDEAELLPAAAVCGD